LEEPAEFGDNSALIENQTTTGRNQMVFHALAAAAGAQGIDTVPQS
jgi:hypothetical protein